MSVPHHGFGSHPTCDRENYEVSSVSTDEDPDEEDGEITQQAVQQLDTSFSDIVEQPTGCRGICGNCGAAVLLWKCSNSDRPHDPVQDARLDEIRAIESIMSDRRRQPRYDVVPEMHDDYSQRIVRAERKLQEIASKVDEIMGWKATVQAHVNSVEEGFLRSEALNLTQQKEICERLEMLRLIEIDKRERYASTEQHRDNRDKRRFPSGPPMYASRTNPRSRSAECDSIWNIDTPRAQPPNRGQQASHDGTRRKTQPPGNKPEVNITSKEGMAGAKRLARQGINAQPKPQRNQGVMHFTPRPNVSQNEQNPAHGPQSNNSGGNNKRPNKPSGLRKPSNTVKVNQTGPRDPPTDNMTNRNGTANRNSKPHGEEDRHLTKQNTRNDTRNPQNEAPTSKHTPATEILPSIDVSGMSTSWYDEDSEKVETSGSDTESPSRAASQVNIPSAQVERDMFDSSPEIQPPMQTGKRTFKSRQQDGYGRDNTSSAASRQPNNNSTMENRRNGENGSTRRPPNEPHGQPTPDNTGRRGPRQHGVDENQHGAGPKDADISGEFDEYTRSQNVSFDNGGQASYAEAAAGEWNTPKKKNKKRKRERSGTKNVGPLRGAEAFTRRQLYVQELEYSRCDCPADLEDMVFAYCKSRGVIVIDTCMIPKGKSRVEAGCKVTVRESD